MSDEAALLAAIVAHADEDTPRLVYADWLDEHGDSPGPAGRAGSSPGAGPGSNAARAAFIRVQCRLADMPPNDPDWVDLVEQQDELVARLQHRLAKLSPKEDEFYFGLAFLSKHEEPFRRGFPYFMDCEVYGTNWTSKETARVIRNLTQLVRTTTVRGFAPSIPLTALTELLVAPVTAELTGLGLMFHNTADDWEREAADYYRLVGSSPALRRVQHLFLYNPYHVVPAEELARATTFDSVRRLTLQNVRGSKSALEKLTRAVWFRRLWHFRCFLDPAVAVPMVAGLGKLPELQTLDLPELPAGAVKALAAGKFPALARLIYGGPLALRHAKTLARAEFPALAAFEAASNLKNDGMLELLKAPWFEQLRVLDLSDNAVGDKGVKALGAHPVAGTLRVLRMGDNSFGKGGLSALTAPDAFPALTTLDLGSVQVQKVARADIAAFLSALRLPRLRHLNLNGWPLGNDGAEALAKNPAFANLTRLSLDGCEIGQPGAKALFASPHLQNLVELRMNYNSIKNGADALTKRTVMPRLGECWLDSIPERTAKKIKRPGLYLMA
jgi:uncharacterized protein (TIGR02996 family)